MSELWKHQEVAISRAALQRDLALFHDPGTGKTRTTIEILRGRFNQARRIERTLILGPLIVAEQWKRQFLQYSKTPAEKILVLTGPGAKRLKQLAEAQRKHPTGFIVITNYDALAAIKGFAEALEAWAPEILICDESHRMKDPTTVRFGKLRPIADQASHRYMLTGSPILNSPMDIFGQLRLLNKGESFMGYDPKKGKRLPMTFFQFRNHYFYDANAAMPAHIRFPNWKVRPGSMEDFKKILEAAAVQAKKEECLDLPPLVETVIPIELGKQQRVAYEAMRDEYVAHVKDQTITASLAITQSLRMQQILNGFVQASPDHEPQYFDEVPRMDALKEKVADLVAQGQKVIVWTHFVPTYKWIEKELNKLKIECLFLTGKESAKVKNENVLQFAAEGGPPVVVCNPQAVGLGVELTAAKSAIYFARTYSRDHQIQTAARNYRGGSEIHDCVTHYDLRAEGTVDDVIANALAGKANIAETLLAWANSQ